MIEIFFNIITRKLKVNEELTFTDEFFQNFPDKTPQVFNFVLMHTKIYISSIIWLVEKQEPQALSKLFPKDRQEVKPHEIDFLRPRPFTREFFMKCNFDGVNLNQRKDLFDKIYFQCFQRISNLLYVGDSFQKNVNYVMERKARVNRRILDTGDQEFIIQI